MSFNTSRKKNKSAILLSSVVFLIGTTSGFTTPLHFSNTIRHCQHHAAVSPLFSSVSAISMTEQQQEQGGVKNKKGPLRTLRSTMRAATGLSLTALRRSMRAATGISLTAMYVSIVGFTSGIVRNTMSAILRIFPTWFRYFLQPFLILYYVPLYMLRNWTSPKKRRERSDLLLVMKDDFQRGLQAADAAQEAGYWPVQCVDDQGYTVSRPPLVVLDDEDGSDTEETQA